MRIVRISPRIFGRFTSETPLIIPKEPMVVVYGKNESGKTTYLDMTVALLASQYDTALMERYGKRELTTFSGSIGIQENGEDLTVTFTKDAKVPAARSKVPRTPDPKQSVIWDKIKDLQLDTVRNLFRVSSRDISNGDATLEKFNQYSLGDRSGQSVTGALDLLKERAKTANNTVTSLGQDLTRFKDELDKVVGTAQEYKTVLERIAGNSIKVEEKKNTISSRDDEKALIDSCGLAAKSFLDAKLAKQHLDDAERNHTLVPESFASIMSEIGTQEEALKDLDLPKAESDLRTLEEGLNTINRDIQDGLRALATTQEDLELYPQLFDGDNREFIFETIKYNFMSLDSAIEARKGIDLVGPQEKSSRLDEKAKAAKQNWEKFNTGQSAQEFLVSPNILDNHSTTAVDRNNPTRLRLLSILLLATTAGISFALEQYISATVLGALAMVIFGNQVLSRKQRQKNPLVNLDASTSGIEQVRQTAAATADAERDAGGARADLVIEENRVHKANEKVDEAKSDLEESLKQIGLGGRNWLKVDEFNSAVVHIKKVTDKLSNLRTALELHEGAETKVQHQTQQLSEIRTAVIALLNNVGIIKTVEELPSKESIQTLVDRLTQDFEEQEGWRRDILNHDRLLEDQTGDSVLFQKLLALTNEERDERRRTVLQERSVLVDEVERLEGLIRADETITTSLATSHRINDLNLSIGETKEQIREAQLMFARLNLLASKMESLAVARAEATKPELHKRVQEMVVAVAEDWNSIDLSGQHPVVTYKNAVEVEDTFLSEGGRTLLYTAMRIAIMQQEAQDPKAAALPLLCDDPLLHLDDERTVQAFRMMRDQAEGHQIIYFTCKQEIRELAEEMQIPVIDI
jgi:energy-coupling factor transporter ATP-binding protein EcfA2